MARGVGRPLMTTGEIVVEATLRKADQRGAGWLSRLRDVAPVPEAGPRLHRGP